MTQAQIVEFEEEAAVWKFRTVQQAGDKAELGESAPCRNFRQGSHRSFPTIGSPQTGANRKTGREGRIDDLIAEHCPDGMEFKKLGEVGEFLRGNGLQKADLTDNGVPAIHYGQVHTYYGVWTNTTKSFTNPTLAAKLRRAKPGDLIIATTSEDDEAVAKATAWLGETEVAVSGDAYIYRHTLNPRYVSYFFQSEGFQRQKAHRITGTKIRRISGTALAKLQVPVPPLVVQEEIVRVLDTFIKLEADLEARKKQYEYYAGVVSSGGCNTG